MKNLLRVEEAAMFALSILLFIYTDFNWWWYPVLLLAPDLSMLGYLGTPGYGAVIYNIFHHRALSLILISAGWATDNDWLYLAGIVLFGHISMDRILGYGLKYPDSFQHTHLGWIGTSVK